MLPTNVNELSDVYTDTQIPLEIGTSGLRGHGAGNRATGDK